MEETLTCILAALCLVLASAQEAPVSKTEAQRELAVKFPYYYTGTNTFGQPVYLVEMGKWDPQLALQEGTSTELLGELYIKFHTTMIQDGLSSGNGSISVYDFKGFHSSQVETPAVQQFLMNQALKYDQLNKDGGVRQVCIVNANNATLDLYNAMKPNLNTTNDLFKLYTENVNEWSPDLRSYFKLDLNTSDGLSGVSPLQVLLNEEFPKDLRAKFPYYLSGYGAHGSPIFIMPLGKYDYKSAIEEGPESSQQLSRLMSQMLLRLHVASVKAPGGRGAVLIVDAKGLSAEQIETPAVRKHLLNDFTSMTKINSEPGLHTIYVINAPPVYRKFQEELESLVNTSNRIQVFYDFRSALREIVKTPIPEEYGGTSDYAPLVSY